jgi:hypothetical protein
MILPLARFFYIQHDTQPLDESGRARVAMRP